MKKMNNNAKRAMAIAFAATMLTMPMAYAASTTNVSQTEQQGDVQAMSECTCENCQTVGPHICTCNGQNAQTPPEMPDSNGQQDGQTPPEMPASNGQQDGQMPPEMPASNGQQDGQMPPEMPDSNGQQDGQTPPEMPASNGQQDGQTPPEMPSCTCLNSEAASQTAKANGQDGNESDNGAETDTAPSDTTDDKTRSGRSNAGKASSGKSNSDKNGSDRANAGKSDSGKSSSGKSNDSSGSHSGKSSGKPGNGSMGAHSGKGGSFGGSDTVINGTAATTIAADTEISGASYQSGGDDENALRIDGATVSLDGITVEKSGGESSNTEDGDFYGQNAAILALNGATVTITDAEITTDAQNGNGVFSYGEGTTVNISDSIITTSQDNSGGIQTTGGGTTNASALTVTTSGNSSAAIRSDRGGGTVNVDGGSYTTNGTGSPAIYSTADITVSNATLIANSSEAVVVEGKNSVTLVDCDASGNMSGTYGGDSDENIHNVMIYQSMSGDAEVGNSSFSMTGGSLTSLSGDMIYVTNTDCDITLSGVELTLANGKLLTVEGNSSSRGWGTAGANGANVNFTADAQTLTGDITVDTISTLDMTMTNGATFTGTINIVDNEADGAAVENNACVTINEGCTWTLTGDCMLTELDNNGTIEFGGYTITLADGTVLSE